MNQGIIILYHANCPDGFGGAWAAWKKFGERAEYIGVNYHDPPPYGMDSKEVFIIDFAYSQQETEELLRKTKSLAVIDHHITAKEIVEAVPNHLFDINHSGAVLAWKYFFPEKEVPLFLRYIEAGDLWKFEDVPDSKAFFALSATLPYSFQEWDMLVKDFEDKEKRQKYLEKGRDILQYQEKLIEELMLSGEEAVFEGYSALVVNSPVLASQLGNAIVQKGYDVAIIWQHVKDDLVKVSLRSDKNSNVHVGELAKKYGGGGHKAAAGFAIQHGEKFPWQLKNT